jgi:hypothetical protein
MKSSTFRRVVRYRGSVHYLLHNVSCWAYSSTLKMEARCSYTALYHNHGCEYLKTYKLFHVCICNQLETALFR